MKRCLVPVGCLLLAAACGGRDPLFGELLDASAGGRDGSTSNPPVRDAAATPRLDAGMTNPNPNPNPTPPTPVDGCTSAVPACITTLQRPCQPSGSCVQQFTSGQASPNICYANGVKILPTSSNGRNFNIRYFGADGRLCYSIRSIQRGAGVTAFGYFDANDKEVASATVERNGRLAITCANQANPQSVELACQPGVAVMGQCTTGMCR